jgi:hypothetical protein
MSSDRKYFTLVKKMLVERIEIDKENKQNFNQYSSFTEKSKRRLELFRRRSLPQTNDDGRSSI